MTLVLVVAVARADAASLAISQGAAFSVFDAEAVTWDDYYDSETIDESSVANLSRSSGLDGRIHYTSESSFGRLQQSGTVTANPGHTSGWFTNDAQWRDQWTITSSSVFDGTRGTLIFEAYLDVGNATLQTDSTSLATLYASGEFAVGFQSHSWSYDFLPGGGMDMTIVWSTDDEVGDALGSGFGSLYTAEFSFEFGKPFNFWGISTIGAQASNVPGSHVEAFAEIVDFEFNLIGVSAFRGHEEVDDIQIMTASGVDYFATVPEPESSILVIISIVGGALSRRRKSSPSGQS